MSKAPERDVETLLRGAAFSNRAHKQGGTQMSDEKRREELKAKINEQLDKLSIEDLEKVAGGAFMIKKEFSAARFRFTVEDVENLKKHGISDVEAGRMYTRSNLNNMGISADSDGELMELLRSWGIAIV